MLRKVKLSSILSLAIAVSSPLLCQRELGVRPTDSGGPLSQEQASYDVLSYDLSLRIDPDRKWISGSLIVEARIIFPSSYLVLDLDYPLQAKGATLLPEGRKLAVERRDDQIWIEYPTTPQPGDEVRVRVDYEGTPREAARPPWVGGFTWERTRSGQHWIGVSCQVDGADLWWPVKDHPADEPERMDLRITVPQPLVVASNGTLQAVRENPDATRTYHWHVSSPINSYGVSINIAPYRLIEREYPSLGGVTVPMTYWVLPERYQQGLWLIEQMPLHLRFLEEKLGPYPFRSEKYGVAETPYLGMEHQTIIAYGSTYTKNEFGFDWLHFHELSHEWFGNLVTATDWNGYWIHEGFASYMEALYAEHLGGPGALQRWMAGPRRRLRNLQAVAPREYQTTTQKYFVPPDYVDSDGDVNFKGAWIVHTLRYVLGEENFFKFLRRVTYPDPKMEAVTDGSQCHFKTTRDIRFLAEEISGQDLSWFFEVYLRRPHLPELRETVAEGTLSLRWDVPGGLPFPMPVQVRIGDRTSLVEMPGGRGSIPVPEGLAVKVDPQAWILKER